MEELVATTSLVLDTSVDNAGRHILGMIPKILSSIHQLDRNLLPKYATSSSSAKPKLVFLLVLLSRRKEKRIGHHEDSHLECC